MPVFTDNRTPKEVPVVETVTKYADDKNDIKSITSLEGSSWDCCYYQQNLREHDMSRPFDSGLDPSVQQYTRINDFIILQQGKPTHSSSDTDNTITISGTAICYPGIVPNVNDHFVANLVGVGLGLFIVVSSKRYTYRRETTYEIEYELFRELNNAIQLELDRRVTTEVYFDRDSKAITDVSSGVKALKSVNMSKIITLMYQKFFDKETNTFLYPDTTNQRIYDPFYVEFITQLLPATLRGNKPRPTLYSCMSSEYRRPITTIWDVLIRGSELEYSDHIKQVELVNPDEFSSSGVLFDVSTSFVDRVIYPREIATLNTSAKEENPDLDYYVFSKAFYYSDEDNMTVLEKIIFKYLKGVKPLKEDVTEFINKDMDDNISNPKILFYRLMLYFYIMKISI